MTQAQAIVSAVDCVVAAGLLAWWPFRWPRRRPVDEWVATGKALTRLGVKLGFKRRWLGLESDDLFRRRILRERARTGGMS